MNKKCTKCCLFLDISNFKVIKVYRTGNPTTHSFCNTCLKKYQARKRLEYKNKERLPSNKIKHKANTNKSIITDFKKQPCNICKKSFNEQCMDIDHINPMNKNFQISKKWTKVSQEVLLKELLKCQNLCNNCHRYKTYQEQYSIRLLTKLDIYKNSTPCDKCNKSYHFSIMVLIPKTNLLISKNTLNKDLSLIKHFNLYCGNCHRSIS